MTNDVKSIVSIKAVILYITLGIGMLVGFWHMKIGIKILFVFNANEGIAAWVCVLFGPILTLPMVLFGIFKQRIAGFVLIYAAIVSFLASLFWQDVNASNWRMMSEFLIRFSIPMCLLGVGLLRGQRGR